MMTGGSDRVAVVDKEPLFRPAIIAPTYNNEATLLKVLEKTVQIGVPLIVVNDGATDATAALLEEWSGRRHDTPTIVLTHSTNRGKAAAMQTGFAYAKREGFTHAATMDTDGQLDPAEIPSLFDAARAAPTSLVLGRRSEKIPGLPKSNLVGWYISGCGLWMETGEVVHDSQCGLRVYPLALFDVVKCWSGRFGFETEIIARAVWAGCRLVEVPVSCIYPPGDQRVSHLRPVRDGFHGFFMHWGLALARLIPWPRSPLVSHQQTQSIASRGTGESSWSLKKWISPLSLWRQVRSSRLEQLIASSAFAHGVFMACMPVGMWAWVAATYGSRRLHHSLVAAIAGACLCIPPMGTTLAKVAITIGHVPLHLSLPDFNHARPGVESVGEVLRAFPISWPLGGVVLGTVLHWITLVGLFLFFRRCVRTKEPCNV